MSIIKLPSNKFLVIDAVPLNPFLKQAIDELTNNGADIEAGLCGWEMKKIMIEQEHDIKEKAHTLLFSYCNTSIPYSCLPWIL